MRARASTACVRACVRACVLEHGERVSVSLEICPPTYQETEERRCEKLRAAGGASSTRGVCVGGGRNMGPFTAPPPCPPFPPVLQIPIFSLWPSRGKYPEARALPESTLVRSRTTLTHAPQYTCVRSQLLAGGAARRHGPHLTLQLVVPCRYGHSVEEPPTHPTAQTLFHRIPRSAFFSTHPQTHKRRCAVAAARMASLEYPPAASDHRHSRPCRVRRHKTGGSLRQYISFHWPCDEA